MAPRFSRSRTAAWVALGLLAAATQASAQGSCDSPEHARGNQLRQAGQDREAYEVFRGIFEREHSGCAQARMGLAQSAMGRWVEADASLRGALARGGDRWIAQNRATLENRLQALQQHLGAFEIQTDPPVAGAELWVDGQRVAALPLAQPERAVVGDVIVEVRAPGYETRRRTVIVSAGQTARETIAMVPSANGGGGAPPVLEQPNPGGPPVLQQPPGYVVAPPPEGLPPPVYHSRRISPIGPIVLGVGVLMAGASVITWSIADSSHAELVEHGCSNAAPCTDTFSFDRASRIRTLDTLTNVLLFGGLGVAVLGAVLTPLLQSSTEFTPRSAWVRPGITGNGVVLEGQF